MCEGNPPSRRLVYYLLGYVKCKNNLVASIMSVSNESPLTLTYFIIHVSIMYELVTKSLNTKTIRN